MSMVEFVLDVLGVCIAFAAVDAVRSVVVELSVSGHVDVDSGDGSCV